ncbi:MAG: SMC-Scp complex subunit ScpB, partial [Polyangiaceae bacterium]|nr:SMC-Scp complex subunit ScpB [Polyangiaceae bacterium]
MPPSNPPPPGPAGEPSGPVEAPEGAPPEGEWAESLQERDVEWAEAPPPEGDGVDSPSFPAASGPDALERTNVVVREHLRGLLEALLFLTSEPMSVAQLAGLAQADRKVVRELLGEMHAFYRPRGLRLDEIAGGWLFRTNPAYAPFLRELTGQKPVKMSRAQIETLAIVAYRQPVTRPEIDEVRGVDSGPVLKALLERDLVRIMGKKEEPGRPLLYGTTSQFLQFFSLNSLRDLPTLREFTELTDDSKQAFTRETGEEPPTG